MFANKRATDESYEDHENLRSLVADKLPDCVMEIVDPLLRAETDWSKEKVKNCLSYIMSIGMACSNEMPRDRMSMAEVVSELEIIHNFFSV